MTMCSAETKAMLGKSFKNGVAGKAKKRKTKEKVPRFSERRHGCSESNRGGCYKPRPMEKNRLLWRPLTGIAKRRRLT